MDPLLLKVQEVLKMVFGDDELVITPETTAEDIEGWDSLKHINVIIAVEKRFGIKFSAAEISRLKGEGENIGSFIALVGRKLGAKS